MFQTCSVRSDTNRVGDACNIDGSTHIPLRRRASVRLPTVQQAHAVGSCLLLPACALPELAELVKKLGLGVRVTRSASRTAMCGSADYSETSL